MARYSSLTAVVVSSLIGFTSLSTQAAVPNAFDVTGDWKVQKAASAPGTPCMIANQYDNGFTVNLSGGQDQILVMAVDFKQDIFDPNKAYDTNLSLDNGFEARLNGKPFNASTLIYKMKSTDGAFKAFQDGQSMTLNVDGNALGFSLKNMNAGLQAMNACAETPLATPPAIQEANAKVNDTDMKATDVAAIAPAAGTDTKKATETDTKTAWTQDKPEEVYIRRQKKPMPSPLAWLKKSDKKEGALDATEQALASLETAAGEDVSAPRPPEPIDLLNPDFKSAPAKVEPVKAVQIDAPIEEKPNTTLKGDEPVLVSRADSVKPLERPETVALFEKESEAVAETITAPKAPVAKVEPKAQAPKPKVETAKKVIAAPDAPIDITQIQSPKIEMDEPVARLAKDITPPQKAAQNKPYEPIRMQAYEPIINTQNPIDLAQDKTQESTKNAATKMDKEPQSAPIDIKPLPGMKVAETKPAAPASKEIPENLPSKSALLAMLEKAEAQIETSKKPDVDAVLSAQQEAAIPIKTARSKDIFISRPLDEPSRKDADKGQQTAGASPQIWEAKAGEDIKIVLARWAERADIDLVWEADNGGRIQNDMRAEGDINAAVQMLLAQNANSLGLDGQMLSDASSAAAKPQMLKASAPSGVKWNASSGTSLRELLQDWSDREGVKLLWRSDRDYAVSRAVRSNGALEEALTSVLGQYDSDTVRPVGQLNIDPVTNQKTLVIETERVL